MKKTASVYIPHLGCPNDCIFCNQIKISGKKTKVDSFSIKQDILRDISTMKSQDEIEVAFFGGTFTALEEQAQEEALQIVQDLRQSLKRNISIKISTRPDAINKDVIKRLLKYKVDVVELGVQSLDKEVLEASNRGHNVSCVYNACDMLKLAGINFGLQLMVGLPQDTKEKLKNTVEQVIRIKPNIARIYPVLVIKDTYLEYMYNKGLYTPLSLEQAIEYTTYMYKKFENSGINVIRIGLQATDNINTDKDVIAGPFHSAFGELVINEIFKQKIEQIIVQNNISNTILEIYCPKKYISQIIGNKKRNYEYFLKKYNITLKIKNSQDDTIQIFKNNIKWEEFFK